VTVKSVIAVTLVWDDNLVKACPPSVHVQRYCAKRNTNFVVLRMSLAFFILHDVLQ
jgi:hypothetical protein